jgi:hypothetical protein
MRHKWILTANNKGFSWNLFAGTAFGTDFYSTLSSYTGLDDYLYDQYYFARNKNSGWLANQITVRDGAFKISTPLAAAPIGRSNQLVITNNFYYDLPIKLPIRAYAGIGYIQKKSSFFAPFQYEGGLAFHLGDVFQVNFPFFLSNDYNTYFKENYGNLSALDRYSKKITFSLSFHSLNPFSWIRDFKLN